MAILSGIAPGASIMLENGVFFLNLIVMHLALSTFLARWLAHIPMDAGVLLTLSLGGGMLALTLVILGLTAIQLPLGGLNLGWSAILLVVALGSAWHSGLRIRIQDVLPFIVVFMLLLLVRLGFVRDLLVPPYADSVQHTLIVNDFLHLGDAPDAFFHWDLDGRHYYHFGFHTLAAWLSGIAHTSPVQSIMLLGQYFQALAILAAYPLLFQLQKSRADSAWIAMLILGFFLPFPAYASNWGKYPAIASLTGIGFCLGLFLVLHKQSTRAVHWYGLLLPALAATTLLHSRALFFCLVFIAIFYGIAKIKRTLSEDEQMTWIVSLSVLFALVMLFVENSSLYWLLSFLVFMAFIANFKLAALLVSFTAGLALLAALPLPLQQFGPRFGYIFDIQFLKITLSVILAILVALGLDSFWLLTQKHSWIRKLRRLSVLAAVLISLAWSVGGPAQSPADCCVFLTDDDLFVMEWMKQNLPADAVVAIAATGPAGERLAADGGAWLEYRTGFVTRKIDADTEFIFTMPELCQQGIQFFYVDGLDSSFNEFSLYEADAKYLIGLGDVKIYATHCVSP